MARNIAAAGDSVDSGQSRTYNISRHARGHLDRVDVRLLLLAEEDSADLAKYALDIRILDKHHLCVHGVLL